jgi:hypothetical protein
MFGMLQFPRFLCCSFKELIQRVAIFLEVEKLDVIRSRLVTLGTFEAPLISDCTYTHNFQKMKLP